MPTEVRAKYVEIIDDILAKSDLSAVTEKSIRNGIQGRVEYDITPQKVESNPYTLWSTADGSGRHKRADYGKI